MTDNAGKTTTPKSADDVRKVDQAEKVGQKEKSSSTGNGKGESVAGKGSRQGAAGARNTATAAKSSEKRANKLTVNAARKPVDPRKQAIREHKERINAELKRTARKITFAGTAVTVIAIIGLVLMTSGQGRVRASLGIGLLILSVLGFGIIGGILYRMYSHGKEAASRQLQRRQSQRARKDLQQFMAKLSVETRNKLMEVDARQKATSGKTAEAMYFQLKHDELSNALQFLCMTSREGEFELKFADNEGEGKLYLGQGTVIHAGFGPHSGVEAVARMLKAGAADAWFFEGRAAPGRDLDMPISSLLINASVMGDELK